MCIVNPWLSVHVKITTADVGVSEFQTPDRDMVRSIFP